MVAVKWEPVEQFTWTSADTFVTEERQSEIESSGRVQRFGSLTRAKLTTVQLALLSRRV
jgi:hypothetical protein